MNRFALLLFLLSFNSIYVNAGCGGPHLHSSGGGGCPSHPTSFLTDIDTVYMGADPLDSISLSLQESNDCDGLSDVKWYRNGILMYTDPHSNRTFYNYTFTIGGPGTYTCKFNDGYSYSIVYLFSTAIPTYYKSALDIKVYPNPSTNGLYTVNFNSTDDYYIKVLDSSGNIIKTIQNKDETFSIDLSGYSRGLYFLIFVSNDWSETKKIVYD